MRSLTKVLGVGLLALMAASPALAANIASPVLKAPAQSAFSGYPSGSGFYFGVNSALATGKANQVSSTTTAANAGALVTQQGEIGGTVGYTWAAVSMPVWFGLEGTFDFLNISSSAAPLTGLSLGGPADFEQIAIAGAPWSAIGSLLPAFSNISFPTLPALPSGVTAGNGNTYLFLGTYEQDVSQNFGLGVARQWLLGLTTGVGARWLLTNASALDIRAEYRAPTQSFCVGPAIGVGGSCAGLGPSYMIRTAVLF